MSMEERLTRQHPSSVIEERPPPYPALPTTVIQPTRGWVPVRLGDLLRFRELLYFLVWSELKVRYKQTVLGVAWAVIQPLAIMVVFTVFFGIVVRVPTGEIPYPIFAFAFAVLVPLIGFYPDVGFSLSTAVFTLPLFLLLAVMSALSVSLWLSALMVQYRDVRLLMNVIMQIWFFATPIIYPSSLVPESWRVFYEALNPMVGVVEGFRWALLDGAEAPNPTTLAISVVLVAVVLVGGLYYFRRVERIFADVV